MPQLKGARTPPMGWDCPIRHRKDRGTQPKCRQESQAVTQAYAVSKEEKADITGHHRVFMQCLIGEPIRRDARGLPMLEEVRRELWQKFPALNKAELSYLETGLFFLWGISMVAYIVAIRWTQEFNRATGVK